MTKRIGSLLVAVLLAVLLAAGGVVFWQMRRDSAPQQGPASGGQPRGGSGPARILLNEVVFQPAAGEPPWVELVNVGGEAGSLDGLVLENQAGAKVALPGGLRLPAGGVMSVRFDGRTGTEANTVHASPAAFLSRQGVLRLHGPKGALDCVAWGDGQSGAASLTRAEFDDGIVAPGMSIGRVPGMVRTDPEAWIPYAPAQTTPGTPNPQPGVDMLLPADGAIVTTSIVSLTWYAVPGAARYRVQIATDPSFQSPLSDRTIEAPPLATPPLRPGRYVWRVQVLTANGTATDFSAPSTLSVRAEPLPTARPRARRSSDLKTAIPNPLLHDMHMPELV